MLCVQYYLAHRVVLINKTIFGNWLLFYIRSPRIEGYFKIQSLVKQPKG